RPNALRIDLEAAAHNVRAVRRLIGARPAPHRHDCRPARQPRLPVFLNNLDGTEDAARALRRIAMSYRAPAFAVLLVTTLLASVAESQSPITIAGHPPVTASGILATFDSATDILRFDDGRMVKLTGESRVVQPAASAL